LLNLRLSLLKTNVEIHQIPQISGMLLDSV
jgi:hypothetical protein